MFQTLQCEIIGVFHSTNIEQAEIDILPEVETDSHGICSQSLRETLESWPVEKPKPKVLYTVPVSTNRITLHRKADWSHSSDVIPPECPPAWKDASKCLRFRASTISSF